MVALTTNFSPAGWTTAPVTKGTTPVEDVREIPLAMREVVSTLLLSMDSDYLRVRQVFGAAPRGGGWGFYLVFDATPVGGTARPWWLGIRVKDVELSGDLRGVEVEIRKDHVQVGTVNWDRYTAEGRLTNLLYLTRWIDMTVGKV